MLSTRIPVLFGLLVLAPSAFAQDEATALEASAPLLQRTGHVPQFPPAPATSSPGAVTIYYTNIAASSTSDVPGLGGTKFTPGNITTAFDKQWFSPDGLHYVFRGDTPIVTTTMDAVVIKDGTLLWQEGNVAPFAPPDTWGPGANRMGINNAGDVPMAHNLFSLNVNDDFIVRWNAGSATYSILAREADTITALPPTVTWDDTLDSVAILTDGRVMWRAVGIDGTGITTANDDLVMLDTTIIAQSGVTIPAGQAGAATNTWENFAVDNNWISPDGLHVLLDGDTNAATTVDDVTTYDGTVVIQEGSILPGSGFAAAVDTTGALEVSMDPGGRWYARGDNVGGQDWVLRNGVVIAKTDDPIGVNDERVFMATTMNQAQESTPTGSAATGAGTFLVDTASNQLYYDITLTGIVSETAAHLHGFAGPGVDAGILYPLPLGNTKRGVITYLEAEEARILAGLTYVNVHTTAFPTGEIRGQVLVGVETWDDTDLADGFFAQTGNAAGDYLVLGLSSAPFDVNGVVVLNGTTVILREGDPVDVNGNGLFDDNAFLQNFGNDDFTLFEDGSVAFSCTLRDSAGVAFAQGIFKRQAGNFQRAVCFGDGSGTACPCGNNSLVGQMAGCVSSIGLAGRCDSIGIASIAADTLVLQGSEVPNGPGLYFRGSSLFPGPGFSFGDGLLCAGGAIIRMGVVFAAGNVSAYPGGTTPAPVHTAGLSVAGDTHYYQLWYRDADLGYCVAASAFNTTNALEVTWGP